MADSDTQQRSLVISPDRTPAPLANLARRTLATINAPGSDVALPRLLIVNADGSAMFRTIMAALAVASDGDEIQVRPGEYRESLVIERSVRIAGDGPRERIVLRPPTATTPCLSLEGGAAHLEGLTIDGTEFDADWADAQEPTVLVAISGGAPTLEALEIAGAGGVWVSGGETTGAIVRCVIHGLGRGILINGGASPRIEGNEVWGNGGGGPEIAAAGIDIYGAGTNPLIRANRVHDAWTGIDISGGAAPRIEDNEVWGNTVAGIRTANAGSDAVVRANRVHDDQCGIWVHGGACPRIEENEVWDNFIIGILVQGAGTDPLIRANRVHGDQTRGIEVQDGAAPLIEENEIWGHAAAGIDIGDGGTNPVVRANRVHDGQGLGIFVHGGASPRIEDNENWGNARE